MNLHPRLDTARAALWALVLAVVVLFVFFFALGGIDPGQAEVATVVVAVLAAAWVVHSWRIRTVVDEAHIRREDRERRGF